MESAIVVDGSRDPVASRRFDDLVKEAQPVVEPVTEAQARIAREAHRDFGRGSGHPARLNFGDSFSYAFAPATGERLLFKGDDFAHTDITGAGRIAGATRVIRSGGMAYELTLFLRHAGFAQTGNQSVFVEWTQSWYLGVSGRV